MGKVVDTSKWPQEVEQLTFDDIGRIGVHRRTNQLYWDGLPLVTERRWTTVERRIAWIGLAIATVGVLATAVQAVAALLSISH
jgi:hypothetical protein